ncbi:MAG: sigma-70 family RNA polymerase sigma factor [Candidatus Acidiferrum sp.]|jgi:RNA polymerase sigma-70 factor (ECF subfamily)
MQEALPAFVLKSEATKPAMGDTSQKPTQDDTSTPSDEQLMLAFAGDSVEAFTELFARYKQPIFGFFRRRVADPARAEELMQETFLAVVRAAGRYEPTALFRTYLYAIAFKLLRAYRRNAAFRGAFLGLATGDREPVVRNATEAEVSLRHAIGKLGRTDREVLLLREFEELSYAEIGELLHLPLNTVRSRLFRARIALRELLAAPNGKTVNAKLKESEEHA